MSNAFGAVAAQASRTELAAISDYDLPSVARFIGSQSARSAGEVEAHLRWFLLENPARQPSAPLGWGLRSSDDNFVGCILCAPQIFRFHQSEIVLMGSSSFYVNERYRGQGGLIFLKYAQLSSRWPLFGNSANREAAQLWKARGAISIPDSDHELLGVINGSPLAEEISARRLGSSFFARLLGRALGRVAGPFRRLKLDRQEPGELFPLASAHHVMDLPIHHPTAKLTSIRNQDFLVWRYFSGNDRSVGVFAYRSKRLDRPVLVTVNQRNRGFREQIRALNVLDIYPEVSPSVCLEILGALVDCYRTAADCIVVRSQNLRIQKELCQAGFLRRAFEAPNGWFLDKHALLPTRDFYFVPADGDWLV
jgi:hypothetical protein